MLRRVDETTQFTSVRIPPMVTVQGVNGQGHDTGSRRRDTGSRGQESGIRCHDTGSQRHVTGNRGSVEHTLVWDVEDAPRIGDVVFAIVCRVMIE